MIISTIALSSTLHLKVHAQDYDSTAAGIAPSAEKWVSIKPPKKQYTQPLNEADIKDPKKLLEFLKSRPEALDPTRMTPFIAVEVGQTLLYGGELRKAVDLLNLAYEKWPNNPQILQAWARALIKGGQPSYVRKGIESWRQSNPQVQVESYTQYLYALSIYLEGPQEPQHLKESKDLIEKLLANDPNYVGPDGTTAARLSSFLSELNQRLSASNR